VNDIFVDQNTGELRGTRPRGYTGVILLTSAAFVALICTAVAISPNPSTSTQTEATSPAAARDAIPFRSVNGGMYVYASLGGVPHNMLLDTGATGSQITVPIANALLARKQAYIVPGIFFATIANGSATPYQRVVVRTMTIGRHTLHNVQMSVGDDGAPVLLGLSELNAIGSFTIDQAHNQIRFN
jgi:predicted aspartyl protease